MIRKGDIVTIRPEWRELGEEKFTYVARNDEHEGRFDMSAVELCAWPIWPSHLTRSVMVEKTGQRLAESGQIETETKDNG
jgi:hypothetical protein